MKNENRREFLKKAAYVAPVMLTLAANPTIARSGSGDPRPHTMRPKENA